MRSLYNAYDGEEGWKNPTSAEWAAFAASRNLREMEVVRIGRALQPAEELSDDVRAALERPL